MTEPEAAAALPIPARTDAGRARALSPTRVLMVLDSFSFGGAENLIAELGRHDPAQLRISVASLSPRDGDREAMFGRLNTAGLTPTYMSVRRLTDVRGFLNLVRTLRRAPVDVVHAHLGYSATLVPLAARLAGKPVVATLHLCPQPDSPWRDRVKDRLSVRVPARLGRLVFVSQYAFDAYSRLHGPARASWKMIPNGVDLDRFAVRHQPRKDGRPVWAVVAALRPDKNHLELLRAWSGVVAAHPGATLLVVGDGPARSDIENAVSVMGLEGSVQLLGRREDIPEILRNVDGVVSASVDEALPTALIEAGACGLPVVAADAGGTREIVIDDINGRLVPLRDVPALTEALLSVIGDPVRASRYGSAGRALVAEQYSLTRWIGRLESLYTEVGSARS
ncbi:glycosyltransferase [Mycobacterium sp. ITM-2016-00317]|uniref:glycosyltransferase n=1 Tax=Mycobacterium sp. ITM-2016-00317 TaxID=2099694 RepID=UPI00287F5F11|nr:glycosyltransferase [Mycobacterium sp. ITM-2016-00317]WNG86966.1 glycosyltransferase [Mycobacterium sp. ITM-2016-00317]